MNHEGQAVLLCDSIHDVLLAERAVKGAGLWCDLVPAPRELSSDCGMALAVRAAGQRAASNAVQAAGVRTAGWFAQTKQGYIPI